MSEVRGRDATKAWYELVTIDLLFNVASYTFLHPFVACIIPLSLKALRYPNEDPVLLGSMAWAMFLILVALARSFDKKWAYGNPRRVDFGEEVIVITGGAGGLGLIIAQIYGMRGANVAVLDVKAPNEEDMRGFTYYQCDIRDKNAIAAAAKKIEQDLGTPTILINNAGIMQGKPLLELSNEEIEKTFQVNLLSQFYTIKQFLPGMLRQGAGTIVTVASVLGRLGCANLSDYCASKAGLIAMHESLVGELAYSTNAAAQNIRLVLCTPGQMTTPLFAGVKTPSNFLGPVMEPVEVAKEIVKMVDAGEAGLIAMPLYTQSSTFIKALPESVQWLIRKASAMDQAMLDFAEVAKRREKSR